MATISSPNLSFHSAQYYQSPQTPPAIPDYQSDITNIDRALSETLSSKDFEASGRFGGHASIWITSDEDVKPARAYGVYKDNYEPAVGSAAKISDALANGTAPVDQRANLEKKLKDLSEHLQTQASHISEETEQNAQEMRTLAAEAKLHYDNRAVPRDGSNFTKNIALLQTALDTKFEDGDFLTRGGRVLFAPVPRWLTPNHAEHISKAEAEGTKTFLPAVQAARYLTQDVLAGKLNDEQIKQAKAQIEALETKISDFDLNGKKSDSDDDKETANTAVAKFYTNTASYLDSAKLAIANKKSYISPSKLNEIDQQYNQTSQEFKADLDKAKALIKSDGNLPAKQNILSKLRADDKKMQSVPRIEYLDGSIENGFNWAMNGGVMIGGETQYESEQNAHPRRIYDSVFDSNSYNVSFPEADDTIYGLVDNILSNDPNYRQLDGAFTQAKRQINTLTNKLKNLVSEEQDGLITQTTTQERSNTENQLKQTKKDAAALEKKLNASLSSFGLDWSRYQLYLQNK